MAGPEDQFEFTGSRIQHIRYTGQMVRPGIFYRQPVIEDDSGLKRAFGFGFLRPQVIGPDRDDDLAVHIGRPVGRMALVFFK